MWLVGVAMEVGPFILIEEDGPANGTGLTEEDLCGLPAGYYIPKAQCTVKR